jgi:hypothetical protein
MWALQKNKNECVPRRRRKILVVSYKEQVKGVIGVRVRETPKSPPHSLLADSLAMRDWCVGWVIQTGILVPTRDQGDIKWHLFEKCVFDCFLLTGSSSGRLKVYRMIWNWSSFRFVSRVKFCAPHVTHYSVGIKTQPLLHQNQTIFLFEKKSKLLSFNRKRR